MEVILKEDVNKLGSRGDVVKVAEGYGRNYLIPKRLAIEATTANRAVIEQMAGEGVTEHVRRDPGGIDAGGDRQLLKQLPAAAPCQVAAFAA